jgi:CubicO group peptidase (beta-lactamase class C family)
MARITHHVDRNAVTRTVRLVLVAIIFLGFGATVSAAGEVSDNPVTAEVDALLAPWDAEDSPGVAVAVLNHGKVVYRRGVGVANLEYGIPINPDTVFQAASLSKQFTAFAIALLADQGKLSLDDDVRKYLPWVPGFGSPITIRQMVHHISGLRDQWELLLFSGFQMEDVITQEHVLELVKYQKTLNFGPGEEYLYTNTGYTLLAEIIERVTGESYSEWFASNIFGPLDMNHSRFVGSHRTIVPNRAYSYLRRDDGSYEKAVSNISNLGPTNLFTTVDDLVKWMRNSETGAVGGKDLIRLVETPGVLKDGQEISYAFGLNIGSFRDLRTIGHGGGQAGFRTFLLRVPEHRLGVAVLANLASTSSGRLAYQIATIYLRDHLEEAVPSAGADAEEPESPDREIDSSRWDEYVGTYLLGPGHTLTVSRRGDDMTIRRTGDEDEVMRPTGSSSFVVGDSGMRVNFAEDPKSGSVFLELRRTRAAKVAPFSPSEEELNEFKGLFHSEELRTTCEIAVHDGQLVLRHPKRGDEVLHPTIADQFGEDMADDFSLHHPWFRSFDFRRSDGGEITGFSVTVGGARDVWFEKLG